MSKVRVCAITCDCYPDDPLVRRTAEAAANGGYEYHVVCSMKDGESDYEFFNGVHVHRICIRRRDGKPLGRITAMPFSATVALWTWFMLRALIVVARLHRKLRFDVVHAHNMPDFLVFSALVPKLMGAKVILHVQDVSPELMAVKSKGLFRKFAVVGARLQERASTEFADHVITVGWPFEERLLKRGVRREKLSSVLNSADPALFPPEKRTEPFLGAPTPDRPLTLVYYGTCATRCGLDTVIRAVSMARANAPNLRFEITGGGDAIPELRALAQTLGVGDLVVFSPPCSLDKVADLISHGDMCVIPYPSDGFMDLLLPTKAYECALMRRPMIASDTFAMHAMFCPGAMRLCKPSSAESFAEAIVDLYRGPMERARLASTAADDYNQNYRWEVMKERYCRLIESLSRKDNDKQGNSSLAKTGRAC